MNMSDLDKTANPYPRSGGKSNPATDARVAEYMTHYKSLDLRLTVLHEEFEDAKKAHSKSSTNLVSKEKALDTLS